MAFPGWNSKAAHDRPLRLLAALPDVDLPSIVPLDGETGPARAAMAPRSATADAPSRSRIGWGSIAILAVVAIASCTAAWWVDRGHHDPGALEIRRIRIANREARKAHHLKAAAASPAAATANRRR